MSIRNLKILNRGSPENLPDWILFAFELGAYIHDNTLILNRPINIAISLPSEQYFSLFIAMGIADRKFSSNKQVRSIIKQIKSLKPGSRIIYQDGNYSRKVSVLCIGPNPLPNFNNEMILWIQDKNNMKRGVPEGDWIEKITILDEELDEIKRSKKVSNKKALGLEGSALLSELYSPNQLNKVSFYPGDYYYLLGNTSQIMDQMNEEIFIYNGVKGNIKDFLYIDDRNSYTNGKLFSSRMKRNIIEIDDDVPVIYSDINSYLNQSHYFINNPNIIVYNRMDNENRLYAIKEELKRKLLQEEHSIITHELLENFISSKKVPRGVELLVWR